MTVSRKKQLSTLEIWFAQRQIWSARDSQKTLVICFERATKRHDWNDNACDVTRKWPLSMSWHWESAVKTLLLVECCCAMCMKVKTCNMYKYNWCRNVTTSSGLFKLEAL